MKNILKKFVPGLAMISFLFVVGIFFGSSKADASNMGGSMLGCENGSMILSDANCIVANSGIQKNNPASNAFMPCCLERHDNSQTIVPSSLQDRIKFSELSIVGETTGDFSDTQQKIYLSSKSPPKKADILSSVVKIE
ncbi:MAG: hypothetical protein PHW24_04640 [Candidatus Moranbacteria bacterium]|nr:hypothetical protein [Candidatus Moranbacteria bacterium]